jgi:stage V sporulation protein B
VCSSDLIMLPIVSNFDLLIVPARLEDAGFTVAQATELYGYLTGMAVPLVNLFTIITAALATSLVPAISQSYAVGDSEQTYRRTATAMRLANIVTIPGGVGLWLLAEPIASMIYHAPQASESIKILAVSVFLLGIHQATTGVLQGLGRTTIPVVNMGVAAVIKITLNWTLTAIPALGIKGASWATVADIGVAAILNIYFVYRHTGFILELSHVFKSGVAAALMGGVIYVSYNWVLAATLSGTYATLVAIVAGVAVYGPVLLIMGGIDAQDVKRVPMIGERLARWLGRLKK